MICLQKWKKHVIFLEEDIYLTLPRSHTGELFEKPVLKISEVAQAFFPYLTLFHAEINFVLIVVSGSRAGATKGARKAEV